MKRRSRNTGCTATAVCVCSCTRHRHRHRAALSLTHPTTVALALRRWKKYHDSEPQLFSLSPTAQPIHAAQQQQQQQPAMSSCLLKQRPLLLTARRPLHLTAALPPLPLPLPLPLPPTRPFTHLTSPSPSPSTADDDIPLDLSHPPPPREDPWAFLQGAHPKRPHQTPYIVPSYRHPSSLSPLTRTSNPFTTNPFTAPRALPNSNPKQLMDPMTLCERERLVFKEIFEQILSSKTVFAPQPNGAPFPSPSLNALFESAVGPQQHRHEISFGPREGVDRDSMIARLALASNFEEFSPAVRAAAAKAAGVVGSVWTSREMEEIKEQLGDKILEMNRCETDLELGSWMETHVFSMVGGGGAEKRAFPPGTYSYLLAEGMRILRSTFNDLQGVFSIFNKIKTLGAESYVVGCSVDVYNQVIAAKWEGTRDLYKVKDLVDEMDTNGIQGNSKTLQTIREIMQDVAKVDTNGMWTHELFSEGNGDVVDGLRGRVEVWEKPRPAWGNIEEALRSMGV
ncbi:uncharacterized protein H6S33_012808 [Morchella sextelata]|uniref:uncharacterized protein n=1 Tax=Morchella sextelata TaxID=1174677 RepID=UPI001D03E299|nr:uncharacterized protein H6S33_012808 [Morchella sextelata]KAH0609322.1 hypothetical protein H6S33_012808 [Morchella sextelata]